MGVQISRSIYSEVSQETAIWKDQAGIRRGISPAMQPEREQDRRRSSDAGSRAHDVVDSPEVCGFPGNRIHQRKKCDPHCEVVR